MTTTEIYVFAKWQVKPGHLASVLELLEEAIAKSREEKGNLFYNLHQSTSDAHTLVLWEGYANEAALEEHRNSSHFQEVVVKQIVPLLDNREVILTTAISD